MKKLLTVLFLAVLLCGTVFGQGFTFSINAVADAVYVRRYLGDFSVIGLSEEDSGSPYWYQGIGQTKLFQSSNFSDGMDADMRANYGGKYIGGDIQLRSKIAGEAQWNVALRYYQAWLKFGEYARILVGNEAYRGTLAQNLSFADFLLTKIDSYGIMQPKWQENDGTTSGNNFNTLDHFPYGYAYAYENMGFATFTATESTDLFTPAGSGTVGTISGRKPLGIGLDLYFARWIPLTLSFSLGGLLYQESVPSKQSFGVDWGQVLNNFSDTVDPTLTETMSFGVRAEGTKLFDKVTILGVYKFARDRLTKLTAEEDNQIIDEQIGYHTFGLYADVTPISGLSISGGYAGLYQTWENPLYELTRGYNFATDAGASTTAKTHENSKYRRVDFPFYHGIDLRASYTGLKGLTITFNGNVSFSNLKGSTSDPNVFAQSVLYYGQINDTVEDLSSREATYLGLYGGLGVKWQFNDDWDMEANVADRLGLFGLKWEKTPLQSTVNELGLYAGASYRIFETEKAKGFVRAGLTLKLCSYAYQDVNEAQDFPIYTAGILDFAVPLTVRVEY